MRERSASPSASDVRPDWFDRYVGQSFDVIVSNPPYIRSRRSSRPCKARSGITIRRALDGGPDGLDAYRAIAAKAKL